jgi:hypothetical protein
VNTTYASADLRRSGNMGAADGWHETAAPGGTPEPATEKEPTADDAKLLRVVLITIAALLSAGVAGIAGVRSFRAVADKFGTLNHPDWMVPATADGVVVALTALRLAAMTRGWRLPGAIPAVYAFLGGTVYLNVKAATGGAADQFAHALAPIAYLILMESLAYLLKLHLRLKVQAEARLTLMVWIVSPVVSTRTWLHMTRNGSDDVKASRASVQRSMRARSLLLIICPSPVGLPFGAARKARVAALQTIRDGLLTPSDLLDLLPEGHARMAAVELLVAVNRAAMASAAQKAAELREEGEQETGETPVVDAPEPKTDKPVADDQGDLEQEDLDGLDDSGTVHEARGRRRRSSDGTDVKRDLFVAAIRAMVASGDLRPLADESRVRNAAAKEIALGLPLHENTATRYLRELSDEILAELRALVPGQRGGESFPIQAANGYRSETASVL